MHDTRKKLTAAVRASGTTLTGLFRVGLVIAATIIIGGAGDVSCFPGRDHFAAYKRHRAHRGVLRQPHDLPADVNGLSPSGLTAYVQHFWIGA